MKLFAVVLAIVALGGGGTASAISEATVGDVGHYRMPRAARMLTMPRSNKAVPRRGSVGAIEVLDINLNVRAAAVGKVARRQQNKQCGSGKNSSPSSAAATPDLLEDAPASVPTSTDEAAPSPTHTNGGGKSGNKDKSGGHSSITNSGDSSSGGSNDSGNGDSSSVDNSGDTSSSSSSSAFAGEATWFTQDGGQGACGNFNADSVHLVALQTQLYGNGEYCGKSLVVTNTDNGKSVTCTVQDECPTCNGQKYNLDMSTSAFDSIGDASTGVLNISWEFQ